MSLSSDYKNLKNLTKSLSNGIKKLVLSQASELKKDLAESFPIFLNPAEKNYFKQIN